MRQHLWCLLFLVLCLTAALVKSESFTEVDDDGNEIEVKRFYIEGRQLNGGRRQCVETRRRKRSSVYGQEDDKSNDEIMTTTSTAPNGIDTAVSMDDDDGVNVDEPAGMFGILENSGDHEEQNMADNEGVDENENENEDADEASLNLPVVAQVAQVTQQQATQQVGAQSNLAAVSTNHNGIVIVQANTPPKVNPQTHAVFELLPVEDEDEDDETEGDDYADGSHLLYQEEISPVTTSAIWSTGEDEPVPFTALEADYQENYDLDEEEEDEPTAKPKPKPTQKPSKRPSKKPSKRPTKKPTKKPSRKPTRRPSRKPKRKPSKKPSRKSNKQRQSKRTTKRPNKSVANRRRPSNNKRKQSPVRRGTSNNNRRRPRPNYQSGSFDGLRETANRRKNHNLSNINNKHKQYNKEDSVDQGTNTYTKTESYTKTGTADDEKNVNCIIINKTTTPRPFWGLFGRSADGDEAEAPTARPYGRRKRINFSLPA